MKDATCATCGTVLPAAAVLYDEQGNEKCQRCLMAAQVVDSQKQVALQVKGIAYGGPVHALVALAWNPGFLMTIAAIATGLYVLRSLKDPETSKHLVGSVEKIKVVAIAGMVLGAVTGLLSLLVAGARQN
jgi:hypothetical protein